MLHFIVIFVCVCIFGTKVLKIGAVERINWIINSVQRICITKTRILEEKQKKKRLKPSLF